LQITLTYPDGSTATLPPGFALDDWQLSLQRPSIYLPNRVGPLPAGRNLAQLRRLRLTGTFEELDQPGAERVARHLRGLLVGRGPVQLRRWAEADRYITVRCTRAHDNPHRGAFRGRVATISFDLEAADPFWYATEPATDERQCSEAYDRWEVLNSAGLPQTQTIVTFTARVNGVINPLLHNGAGGYLVRYTGTLNEGESVVIDGATKTALKGSTDVRSAINAQWITDGFPFTPGRNILTYQDGENSSHACTVTIEWRPAWW
jgi:phage-related protein